MIYRLGELIERMSARNTDLRYGVEHVRGINTEKILTPTRADLDTRDLRTFRIVRPNDFVFSRRLHQSELSRLNVTYNDTGEDIICTEDNVVFRISRPDLLLVEYLFMYFSRSEFDRYASFNAWGSSVRFFNWEDMCDVKIPVPPIDIQRKYAGVFTAMKNHHCALSRGIEDLRLVCDLYIEDLRRKIPCVRLGDYIERLNDRNTDKRNNFVMGLSTQKTFREPSSRVNRDELASYKIVRPNEFAFVPTTDSWKVLAFALNTFGRDIVVSPIYEVFRVDTSRLVPEYLAIWLSRKEFDRYARFHSWGSARENFSFDDMCNVQIPIPDITIQHSIANIYTASQKRKSLAERLKTLTKNICPILIKGAIDGD